jgi:O-antigen ligase
MPAKKHQLSGQSQSHRPTLQASPSLDAALGWKVLLVMPLMSAAYATWVYLSNVPDDVGHWKLLPVILVFVPLFLWALYDYRFGLLLAVMATPLLHAPIIPHGFTQGFADPFAACSIIGYLLRHPNPSQWRDLWRREYVWLLLILAAAAASLVLTPVWGMQVPYGIKYGLAEIAGYSLAMLFMAIFVHEIRSQRDFKAFMMAGAAALLIVVLFSLAGLGFSLACNTNSQVSVTLSTNSAIHSTFMNPNYHAAYLICVLPFALWFYLNILHVTWIRRLVFAGVILLIFLVQMSLSRAGLIGLVIVWLGWLAITYGKAGTKMMSIFFGLMLLLNSLVWGYAVKICVTKVDQMLVQKVNIEFIVKTSSKNFTSSLEVRKQLAYNAINLWHQNPVTGVGAALMSNFSFAGGYRNRSHNVFLTTIAEQGIIGVSVWMGWFGCLAMIVWRARRRINEQSTQLAFLALALTSATAMMMFMDGLRVISLWQIFALILAWPLIPHEESHISDDIR